MELELKEIEKKRNNVNELLEGVKNNLVENHSLKNHSFERTKGGLFYNKNSRKIYFNTLCKPCEEHLNENGNPQHFHFSIGMLLSRNIDDDDKYDEMLRQKRLMDKIQNELDDKSRIFEKINFKIDYGHDFDEVYQTLSDIEKYKPVRNIIKNIESYLNVSYRKGEFFEIPLMLQGRIRRPFEVCREGSCYKTKVNYFGKITKSPKSVLADNSKKELFTEELSDFVMFLTDKFERYDPKYN